MWPSETSVGLRTKLFRVITRRVVVICCRRFGTNYRSHPQGLRIGRICCRETSVRNHVYSLCNNTEKCSSQLLRSGSFKSRKCGFVIELKESGVKVKGRAVAWWLRYYATNQQVAGSIPDGVIGIFQ
jgi:hypothetical protein